MKAAMAIILGLLVLTASGVAQDLNKFPVLVKIQVQDGPSYSFAGALQWNYPNIVSGWKVSLATDMEHYWNPAQQHFPATLTISKMAPSDSAYFSTISGGVISIKGGLFDIKLIPIEYGVRYALALSANPKPLALPDMSIQPYYPLECQATYGIFGERSKCQADAAIVVH